MDEFTAWSVVQSAILRSGDAAAVEALRVLVQRPHPAPPGRLGVMGGTARELAQQIHKTGDATGWAAPPLHSQAMERLIHRLTCLLEAFLDVHEEARGQVLAAAADWKRGAATPVALPLVDELYQAAFCDECGGQLAPDGKCSAGC